MKKLQFKSQQSGFTLIELVVVIVILGILAATALPRFADMSKDARIAKVNAAVAALKTGSSLFHAQWLVAGSPADAVTAASTVTMEGMKIGYVNGYPDATLATTDIMAAAGITAADYDIDITGAPTIVVSADANHLATCSATYTASAAANTAPVITVNVTTC